MTPLALTPFVPFRSSNITITIIIVIIIIIIITIIVTVTLLLPLLFAVKFVVTPLALTPFVPFRRPLEVQRAGVVGLGRGAGEPSAADYNYYL